MTTSRLELRQLAHFVSACQNSTISEAARELGIASSALSIGLRTLEDELQMKLFLRKAGYLTPLPAALWLFQQAMELLHAESHLRAVSGRDADGAAHLQIDLDLSFAIGRFTKAVSRAVSSINASLPGTIVEFRFLENSPPAMDTNSAAPEKPGDRTYIRIGYCPVSETANLSALAPFYDDPWYSVGLAEGAARPGDASAPLIVLEMRPALIEAVTAYAERQGMGDRLILLAAQPADLARLLSEFPHARFLMPRSMIADRLGLVRVNLERLDPPLVSVIGACTQGPQTDIAGQFLAALHESLDAREMNAVFDPALTARQIRYFNLVHRCGGISAAARVANVTQPSVSSQIQKMEAALGTPLFQRQHKGAISTGTSHRLLPFTMALEERLNRIIAASRDIAAHTQSTISIGMLPSSGHDSAITDKLAQALTSARAAHPDYRMRIVEGTSAFLHDRVKAGELNLAIVGTVQGQMARVFLGRSERLSVIANPALDLGGHHEILLADACKLPMVLGQRHLSIHQAFVEAAALQHIKVQPVMEVGSLPLAIALVRKAPICTILPISSVQQDVAQGRLIAAAIVEDVISGNLSVIFSAERTLSEAEREIIQSLIAAFGKPAD
jgi:molybdate transport repressor ModE-like protein